MINILYNEFCLQIFEKERGPVCGGGVRCVCLLLLYKILKRFSGVFPPLIQSYLILITKATSFIIQNKFNSADKVQRLKI